MSDPEMGTAAVEIPSGPGAAAPGRLRRAAGRLRDLAAPPAPEPTEPAPEPATFSTPRRCPYCATRFALGDCPIVATSFPGVEFRGAADVQPADIELPSGRRPIEILSRTGWPVIAPPPSQAREADAAATRESVLASTFQRIGGAAPDRLPSLLEPGLPEEDVPARACPSCHFPLPRDIDEREAAVVAVVGVNRVGKTHLLAASLSEAYRNRALAALGCTEFVPDETTSTRFMMDYFQPLFRDGELLGATQDTDDARFEPLVFNVTLDGKPPFSLVLHDIAGEAFGDHRRRAQAATFLRAARGLIFVIDPRDIDDVRKDLPDWTIQKDGLGFDQGALLAACLKDLGKAGSEQLIPVAVTVAKADLLAQAHDGLPFLAPASPASENFDALLRRVRATSREVAEFLDAAGAHTLLGPARAYAARCAAARRGGGSDGVGTVTYHATSALGSQPDVDDRLRAPARPLNCSDPLAAVLAQIPVPG